MDDLFARPKPRVGTGNALFLCDLADGVSDADMRARYKRGDYPGLNLTYAKQWKALFGRS
jgi:hypothetical protein